MQRYLDMIAKAGHGLVNSVIHHLINQMVQPAVIGRADIHARTAANRLQPFQHLNVVFIIMGIGRCFHALHRMQLPIVFQIAYPFCRADAKKETGTDPRRL